VFGDSDEEDIGDSQGVEKGGEKEGRQRAGKSRTLRELLDDEPEEEEDEFDFIVDDHGQPIRRRKEDGTYTEP
jgi:hypothetical protein